MRAGRMLAAVLVLIGGAATAHAHGPPPDVLSVLGFEGALPSVLRLSAGLAYRDTLGVRFVCPAMHGDELAVPAEPIDDAHVLVAAGAGLTLLGADGMLMPHPDPAAVGSGVLQLARGPGAVFALRFESASTALLRIDLERSEPIAELPHDFGALAADGDRLALSRFDLTTTELELWSVDAEVLQSWSFATRPGTIAAHVRLVDSVLYAVVLASDGATAELLRAEADGSVTTLRDGARSIVGPAHAGASVLVAVDGALFAIVDDALVATELTSGVTCVGEQSGHAYVCIDRELHALDGLRLGPRWFTLAQLLPPDLGRLEGEVRERCNLQWEHYELDLMGVGIQVAQAPSPASADAGAESGSGSGSDSDSDPDPDPSSDSGCAIRPGARSRRVSRSAGRALVLLPALLAVSRLRRRRRAELAPKA